MSYYGTIEAKEAEERAIEYIKQGMADDDIEMVLVVCNREKGLASILSMKMDEETVAIVLAAAAAQVAYQHVDAEDRVLN